MSTTHGQPGLSSDQRSTIRSTILSTRHTLEGELRRQLEKYGIYEDKKLPLENLKHLSVEEIHTRRTLDAAIERELESTEGDLERSITNYVREATKTFLNRFVALKTIEVRGLVDETITERPEYGNRSYMHHTVAEIAGELTNAPDDGFAAALDLAYQEIGAEIRMIFEESEHTAIDLDAQVREEVLDELDEIDNQAWESDEALGWVYQYFGEEERKEIDDRVDEENYKIAGTDIATKTQLFTPRYIVEWMVDNSLGRTWLEMKGAHTSINDEDSCFYLTPLEDSLINREKESVENITVFDPACGSGHMLFYAFDVLYEMYLEEGEIPEEYIPREILRNNLYGIDIDSGAAQIAALSLYLKAKENSPDVTIPRLNIVSADAVLINGNRKQEILGRARSELEEEILEQIWRSFDNIREFGSLVRVDERIDEILEDHKKAIQASGQVKFTQEGSFATQSSFVSGEGEEESWDQVKERLLEEVGELASDALDRNDPIEEMFAGEVGKTVELLDLLVHQYDVVVSNPPYLSSAKMGEELKQFLKSNFTGYRNLYTCFIERAADMTVKGGYATLVTPEDFMTQYSYRKLREMLISDLEFIEGVHLSRYGFDQQKDSYTIPFLIRSDDPDGFDSTRFYRMTHEQPQYETFEDKIQGLNEITKADRQGREHNDVYVVNQNSFRKIDRQPFVYWFGQNILDLFDNKTIGDKTEVYGGVKTGDNDHHLRKLWEIPEDQLQDDYELYVSNGRDFDYFDYTDTAIRWENQGQNIIDYADEHGKNYQGLSKPERYFEAGVIFRDFSDSFTAKHLEEGHIFSNKAYFVETTDKLSIEYLLGLLNSAVNRFIMMGLNPGLNFNPGDAKSMPIPASQDHKATIEELVGLCIDRRKRQFQFENTAYHFEPKIVYKNWEKIAYIIERSQVEAAIAGDIISNLVFREYGLDERTRTRIRNALSSDLTTLPHIDVSIEKDDNTLLRHIPSKELNDEQYQDLVNEVLNESGSDPIEVGEKVGISPISVVDIWNEQGLYETAKSEDSAELIVSTALGNLFGKYWKPAQISDGIFVTKAPAGIDDQSMLKDEISSIASDDVIGDVENALGTDLTNWLNEDFFRNTHCKSYRRRGQRIPLYWHLESPASSFGCLLYYHNIDGSTLSRLRGKYVDEAISKLENEKESIEAQLDGNIDSKDLRRRQEEISEEISDLTTFRDTLDKMIDDGVTVDVEQGIWENIKEWDQYDVLETGLPKLKSSYTR